MDKRKDARGLSAAYKMSKDNFDFVVKSEITDVCKAVINRYDQKKQSVELTVTAAEILTSLQSGMICFKMSTMKKLCEYLIG